MRACASDTLDLRYGGLMLLGARAGLSAKEARDIVAEVGAGLRAVMPAMLEAFEAHGQGELGRRVAAAWDEGLTTSLGEEPGGLAAAPSARRMRGGVARGQAGPPPAGTDGSDPAGAEWERLLPEPDPFGDPGDPFRT